MRLKDDFPVTEFTKLGLAAPILKALSGEGYTTPTPIQTMAIPILLAGRDLIGLAQTGTGKTAAFALPILHRLSMAPKRIQPRTCRVLVLAPTRELAAQIGDSFRAYGRHLGMSVAVVFGGASMHRQVQALSRGVDVLVATPGRLIDHVGERTISLEAVEMLVLDEADHMLDIGFIHPLKRIAKLVPAKRQTILFSATMPSPIEELAGQFLTDAQRIAVTPVSSTAERVRQQVVHVDHAQKADLLDDLLGDKALVRGLVFTRTKHGADRLKRKLEDAGHRVEAIHGNKSQPQRERALENFRNGVARLLIATEIAARGIDVDGVSHVINFDLPNVPEQYVHRIGRTARAGESGVAISFCAPDERVFLRDIERLTKLPVDVMTHALSLPTPQPGDRLPPPLKQGGRSQRPPQRAPSRPRSRASSGGMEGDRRVAKTDREKPMKFAAHGGDTIKPARGGERDSERSSDFGRQHTSRKGEAPWSNHPALAQKTGQKSARKPMRKRPGGG